MPSWGISWPLYTTTGQRRSLLQLIAVSIEEKLPLIPLLEAWTEDERGIQRRRLLRLLGFLRSGVSLPDAIESVPGVLREEDLLALRFDSQLGTRTAAVRDALAGQSTALSPGRRHPGQTLLYVAAVSVLGLLIVTFLHFKIFPMLQRMLFEFAVPAPLIMTISHDISTAIAQFWWLGALLAFVGIWLVLFTRLGRFGRKTMFAPRQEWQSADVIQKLNVAGDAGRPLSGALATLARYHFDSATRNQLLFVRNEVELGVDAWQSLSRVGLLTPAELRLLKAADRVGNRSWVLKQLVEQKRRRTIQRRDRSAQLLLPALLILMGGFVLFQALTVFVPLTKLLHSLI